MIKKDYQLIILIFFTIILAIFESGTVNAQASADVFETNIISVEAKNKPLNKVLSDIGQKTGYTFTVDSRWHNLPVTVSLNDVALHEALRMMLKNFNIAIIQDNPRQKHMAIVIGDSMGSHTGSLDTVAPGDYPNQMELEKADETIQEQKNAEDPLDMEVIPPDQPDGKGVTLRELQIEESYNEEKTEDPLDMEVLPPDQPDGKGVTLRELQNAESRDEENLDNNFEVIPPEEPGEKGVSQREIEQIQSRQKSKEAKPKIPVPIDNY
jgi:hypothetical protein